MSSSASGLGYRQDLFADRQEVIDLVRSSVERLRQGSPPERRAVRCYGVAGSGKSWLLCHLQQIVADEYPEVLALRLCLVKDPAHLANDSATYLPSPPVAAPIIIDLLRWLIERVIEARGATPAWVGATDDPQRLSERLGKEIATTRKPLVLLVDGLDEHLKEVVQAVEQYCLLPLLQRSDVLLILAVRLPPSLAHTWSRELVFHSQDHVLEPFSLPDTVEQLSKAATAHPLPSISPAQAEEIISKGGGYPLNNFSLARALDPHSGTWPHPALTFRSEANRLLEPVDAHLRPAFQALCVLRQFDEYRMEAFFPEFGLPVPLQIKPAELSRITRLIVWDGQASAYVMDEALRRLLENALHAADPGRWRALHERARDLYREWERTYPGTAARWRAEAEFHEKCLKAGQPLPPQP